MWDSSAPTVHSICHIDIFYLWVNGRDQIDYKLKITRTKLIATKMYGLNWLWLQNIGIKIVFSPKIYKPKNICPTRKNINKKKNT